MVVINSIYYRWYKNMGNMENNLGVQTQSRDTGSLENQNLKKEMRGKILYNFFDGHIGFFNSTEELIEAIKEERENMN